MKQRDVQGPGDTTWSCVQPLSGLGGQAAEEAAERLASDDGTIPVVCTPSGGEQSVRLELPADWLDRLSDEELATAIEAARAER